MDMKILGMRKVNYRRLRATASSSDSFKYTFDSSRQKPCRFFLSFFDIQHMYRHVTRPESGT